MPRKRKLDPENHVFSGRPPKDPFEKIGRPVRALVTTNVYEALRKAAGMHGSLNLSDMFRLSLFHFLTANGLMTPELYEDPTWTYIKEKGLV